MSLFPAYSNKDDGQESDKEVATSWLTNSSFTASIEGIKPKSIRSVDSDSSVEKDDTQPDDKERKLAESSSSLSSDERSSKKEEERRSRKRKRKEKKKKKKLKKEAAQSVKDEDLPYIVDTKRDLGYLNMERQSKHARPRYESPKQLLPGVFLAKMMLRERRKSVRYFSKKVVQSGQDSEAVGEELKKCVESLNKAVHEHPQEVDNWVNLINFQDDFFKFQSIQFKTVGERERAATSQKLAILERAIAACPDEHYLHKLWLTLALDCCTSDEVDSRLTSLMRDGGQSLLLSLGRIMLTQQSMPRCTVSAVMKSYKQTMEELQRSRHLSSDQQDCCSLELLYHACVFLEQGGLWETAWTILKLILSLNFSLDVADVSASEEVVLEEENKFLEVSKGVPVWHLWTRLEALRQGHHFFPVRSSDNYPQRVVGTEDIVELVHHVRRPAQFRLLLLLPLLAKVPLVPRSHTFLATFLSQLTPWALDTEEWQLAAVFCQSPLLKLSGEMLAQHLPLSPPPQYLRALPGQREFLELVVGVFHLILGVVTGRQRVAIGVWYLRFWRWLDELARLQRYQPAEGRPNTKTVFKEFLKRDENRDSVLFYVEYGLWEMEQGNVSASIKTLSTLIASRGAVLDQADNDTKADLCALYRSHAELQIVAGQLDDARATLRRLCRASSDAVACSKLKHVALEAQRSVVAPELEDMMLPNFTVDWVSCYALFLALVGSVEEAVSYLNQAIDSSTTPFIRERLYESLISIIRKFGEKKPRSEIPTVRQMMTEFPLSSVATGVMAEILVNGGGLWWKDMGSLVSEPAAMGAVVGVCATLERQRRLGGQDNRCRAMMTKLTTTGSRTSALVHRMNLAVLAASADLQALEAGRVLALEAFPWNKSLYMDAIAASPVQLLPLTDLLVEKDIRIHITPDEIEALRD